MSRDNTRTLSTVSYSIHVLLHTSSPPQSDPTHTLPVCSSRESKILNTPCVGYHLRQKLFSGRWGPPSAYDWLRHVIAADYFVHRSRARPSSPFSTGHLCNVTTAASHGFRNIKYACLLASNSAPYSTCLLYRTPLEEEQNHSTGVSPPYSTDEKGITKVLLHGRRDEDRTVARPDRSCTRFSLKSQNRQSLEAVKIAQRYPSSRLIKLISAIHPYVIHVEARRDLDRVWSIFASSTCIRISM